MSSAGHFREVETEVVPAAKDVELMAEKQVLDFKPAPRLDHVDDEHS
jgi:hypothetical protein